MNNRVFSQNQFGIENRFHNVKNMLNLHGLLTYSFCFSWIHLKQNVKCSLKKAGIAEDSDVADSMCTYLLSSKSDNTIKKFFYSFKKCKKFCVDKKYKRLHAQHNNVAVFKTELLDSQCSVHTTSSVVYSLTIKWAHDINGLEDPTNNAFVKKEEMFEGL